MRGSKLGFFTVDGYNGLIDELVQAKPRVVKAGDPGLLRALSDALDDDTVLIGRNFTEVDDFGRYDSGLALTDPVGAARYWMNANRPAMQQAPKVYWESFNEMANWGWMRQYGDFETERQRLMAAEGFHACVGNFSTGSPPVFPDADDPWPQFYPALEAADRYNSLLGLHEYGGLYMDLFYGPNQRDAILAGHHIQSPQDYSEGWLACRYRKVWSNHIEPSGWTNIRIVITEAGLDRAGTDVIDALVGYPVGPWTQCQPYWASHDKRPDGPAFYAEQLEWYDRQLQQDKYVVGATIFCRGANSEVWKQWDVRGDAARNLDNYILNTSSSSNKFVISPTGLYMRTRPFGAVIKVLGYEEVVEIISTQGDWSFIESANGIKGWSMTKWLK